MRRAFLDMDGVLFDFVGAACAAHNRPDPYDDPANLGCFDMEKIWGMSPAEFWAPTNSKEFWLNLPKTLEADQIVALAEAEFGSDNVAVLTAPSLFDGCIDAKRHLMENHYPQFSKRIIFAAAKEFLAYPDAYLIDDRTRNITRFNDGGGHGVIVPRPWNSANGGGRPTPGQVMDSLIAQLGMGTR